MQTAQSLGRKPRIACYGYVNQHVGSGVGATFSILEALLQRGIEIDFYGWPGYNDPEGLKSHPNFRFIPLQRTEWLDRLANFGLSRLPRSLYNIVFAIVNAVIFYPSGARAIQRTVLENHAVRNYDLALFLELYSLCAIPGIPTISRPQGPPQTEQRYLKQNKQQISQLCGPAKYWQIMFYYWLKARNYRHEVFASDLLLCASEWTREQLIAYGYPESQLRVVSYPVNLGLFKPLNLSQALSNSTKTILWLGRFDSRKRLDLLLDAYHLLLEDHPDVVLKIVGRPPSHLLGYEKLIENFPARDRIEWIPEVAREDVPATISACDLLVQASEGENFGFAVAEALSCGKPVVVGATNGTKDYVSSSSIVFEQYHPQAIKEAIGEMLQRLENSPEIIQQEARQAAEHNFDLAKVIDDFEASFQQVCPNLVSQPEPSRPSNASVNPVVNPVVKV
jgi:glycosyltransferase involved in cell wall biosynthesis